MSKHGHGHGSGGHDSYGNPEDLEAYLARLEGPERAAWQKPDEVVAALAPRAEDVVCEIGGGPGYFALRFAARARHVYAVDVEPRLLAVLRDRVAAAGRTNVTPVLALPSDPLVPEASCDLAVVIDTFHHFPDGVAYLRRLARSLRPGGRLANIDFHRRELPVGPPVEHKVSREDFLKAAAAAGLEVVDEPAFLPYQYFFVMRPKGR